MKKHFLFLILFAGWYSVVLGQTTPNCTDISSYIVATTPLTQSQINSINSSQAAQFPNVGKLEEPTASYNCHNYAWVKRDGGGAFWLNSPGDDAFWNDNSYLVSSSTTNAELRVSYQGDHTAVTTGAANECISKWGAWGLYRHNTTDVPAVYLPGSTQTYYEKNFPTAISGPSSFCYSDTYSLSNVPSGASVTWSVTGSFVAVPSGNSVTVYSMNGGPGVLSATVNCGQPITKSITGLRAPVPDYLEIMDPHGGEMILCPNQTYWIEVGNYNSSLYSQVNWYLPSGWSSPTAGGGSNTFSTTGTFAFMIQITTGSTPTTDILTATFTNSCGEGEAKLILVSTQNCGGYGRMAVYPNPANAEINIENLDIAGDSGTKELQGVDEVKLIDEKGRVLQAFRNTSKAPKIVLDVNSIPNGTYFLHIMKGKETTRKQIVIRH